MNGTLNITHKELVKATCISVSVMNVCMNAELLDFSNLIEGKLFN